jgi:HAMP domain-containing protein
MSNRDQGAADDLADLEKMLGAGDSAIDRHYLDLLRIAIEAYRHDLREPELRVKHIAETSAKVSRVAEELAALVLRLAEDVKGIETPGYFSPARGDVSGEFLDAAPEIAASLEVLRNVAEGVSGEVAVALGDFPDAGGREGIRSRLLGSAKDRFVSELVTVWEHFRGPAKARAEGPFYDFLRAAHELATGDPSASVERHGKRIPIEAHRRREEFEAALARVSELRDNAKVAQGDDAARLNEEALALSEKVFSPDFWRSNRKG